jgi:flagellar basal-body rod protein FlgG
MATIALSTATTGLSALSTQIDVISNNLANVNTISFKSNRVNFEDLLYQNLAQPGVETAKGDQRPAGVEVGLGVRIANTARDFKQGPAINTGNSLDVMIEGNGFFAVDAPSDIGTGIAYTRSGNFFRNAQGELVLGNSNGPRLQPPITIPSNAIDITVSQDGKVLVTQPGSPNASQVAQLQLTSFVNPVGLNAIGGNLFTETSASGPPITGVPGENGMGLTRQGFLEGSNVNPVAELVDLIKAQRAFEMNSQTIQAADQTLQVVANLRR